MSERGPRVSVLLPTHDRADVVGFAIRSALAQTEPDLELLVVGDGCTDDTAAVVGAFQDPRVRWFDLPKAAGFGYANRNVALREARGELVAFLAHDDLWLPDHLERMAALFEDPRVAWASSRPAWVSREGAIVPLPVDLRRPGQLRYVRETSNTVPASGVVIRRAAMERAGRWPEDELRGGDRVLWMRIIDGAGEGGLAWLPEVTALHFLADWRRSRDWGAIPFDAWLPTVRPGPTWPAALQVPVADGRPEQAVAWDGMAADPRDWTTALRGATGQALEELAWQGAIAMRERRDLGRRVARVELELGRAQREPSARIATERELRGALVAAEDERIHAHRVLRLARGTALGRLALWRIVDQAAGTLGSGGAWRPRWLGRVGRLPVSRLLRARLRNPLFDDRWYRARYPDVRAGSLGSWVHWRRFGWREGRMPNALFDTRWYLARNPDVRASGIDPLEHYLRWGGPEGRDPGPRFDASAYLRQHADVAAAGMDALWHYLRHGSREGRATRAVPDARDIDRTRGDGRLGTAR